MDERIAYGYGWLKNSQEMVLEYFGNNTNN